jgi:hypothetical protein
MMMTYQVVDNTGSTAAAGREVTSDTLIGFGLIACILAAIWLIRRSKA